MWHLNFLYLGDHAFIRAKSPRAVYWSKPELTKLHLHFYHPSARKLLQGLARARPNETAPVVLDALKRIWDVCSTCQELHAPPFRFRVSIPENSLRFNAEVYIYLLWINKRPILHVVEIQRSYQNAAFVVGKTAENLWKRFVQVWASVYCGFPHVLRVDREPLFMAAHFRDAAEACGVVVQASGIEVHNALGVGERYHAPLRCVFNAILLYDRYIDPSLPLRLAVKAINDTMGTNGLVPSLLVYDRLPRFPGDDAQPTQSERKSSVVSTLSEAAQASSEARVNRALRRKVPPGCSDCHSIWGKATSVQGRVPTLGGAFQSNPSGPVIRMGDERGNG